MPRRGVAIRAAAVLAGLVFVTGCTLTPDPTASPSPEPSVSSPAPSETPSSPPQIDAITIDSPPDGARVPVPVSANGTANTFEAALTVDVMNEANEILCVRHVLATSGSGTRGTWQARLGFAPQRDTDEPVTLRAYELSASDGSMTNLVERPLTLSPEHPPIFLTSPVCGDVVAAGGAMSVQGLATVFEAALTVEVRDAAGAAVFSRNMMTAEGGVESPFGEFITIPADLPAGFYDLVAFNYSAKDGNIENEFPVQIEVR
ncbi:MAG: Gmad2 immunoglobulin-like domain-containing protein [Mycetocola sp.]